ncbi:hypothetical protein BS50DRAFT_487420 [Corynespora cassiicola Philippines]|uniref:Tyrosine specific protein phosphatases domain-containing protein n=1 Tax=Corynespora cassiicola Philippines TaxID=1448308 RepID=A0A2T2P0T8_CORCC|nr:hypothetical protein BS50DRAFT_487420 [Corynespora cassiicola Philippines]
MSTLPPEDAPMPDNDTANMRLHAYTYRLPTAPRIVVPPPTLSADMPTLSVGHVATPVDEIDCGFLKEYSLENIVRENTLLEWAYDRRRQAQLILPWLYLGPMTAAKDKAFIAREGITMVLAIRTNHSSMNGVLRAAREAGPEVATIEAANYHALVGKFAEATRLINRHVANIRDLAIKAGNPQLGKVLVFCESGNEKSAVVTAAYLMEMLDDFDYIKAMQVCQAQRFCVNFDDTLKGILRAHWDILLAKRSVANSRQELLQSSNLTAGLQQRSIDDTHDDEAMELDSSRDPSDLLRFSGRDNTPFRDQN